MAQSRQHIILLLIALAATFICFYPTLDNGFVNWDDNGYVVRNWLVKDINLDRFMDIIKTPQVVGTYQPVTMLSLAIDYNIGNGSPLPFHITNLVLHLLSVVLLFYWIRQLTGRVEVAFICALLFGIHPMHVEPVAWVSSRKDVLYTFFYLLALITYTSYAKGKWKAANYAFTLILFFVSLMSKSVAVILPAIFLLVDYLLNRKNLWKLVLEKLPFLLMAAFVVLLAVRGQREGNALEDFDYYPFSQTFFVGMFSLLWYLVSLVYPFKLSAYHPYPFENILDISWYFYASVIPVIVLLALAFIYGRKNKHFVFGVGFFLLSIGPLLKILPFGKGMLAERYTYVAYIGLFYLLGWLFIKIKDGDWQVPAWGRKTLLTVSLVWVVFLGVKAFVRGDVWENGGVMWGDVMEKYPDDFFAYSCAADYHYLQKDYVLALQLANKSITLYDEFSDTYNNRGKTYERLNKPELAFDDYTKAIELDSTNYGAYLNRAILHMNLYNDAASAIQDISEALRQNPYYSLGYINRGVFYESMGEKEKAELDYGKAIELEPNNAAHYRYRGVLRYYKGDWQGALKDYNTALAYNPNYGNVYYLRSKIYRDNGEMEKARRDVNTALELGFNVRQDYLESLK